MIENLYFRDMFDVSVTSKISQGSIFNFAHHEDYTDSEILGVIITARCDIANSKTSKYSFLPAIPFRLWLDREMPELLKKAILKGKENAVLDRLSEIGLSRNSVKLYGENKVLEVARKKIKKDKTYVSLEQQMNEYKLIKYSSVFAEHYSSFKKDILRLTRDVVENKNMDYFFIDNVGGFGPCVVSLREVNHLEKSVAERIVDGIEISSLNADDISAYRSLNLTDKTGLVSSIGSIKSPYIELMMQRFSENYTRIGVSNPHPELTNFVITNAKDNG